VLKRDEQAPLGCETRSILSRGSELWCRAKASSGAKTFRHCRKQWRNQDADHDRRAGKGCQSTQK
jgi:hypothetical protein